MFNHRIKYFLRFAEFPGLLIVLQQTQNTSSVRTSAGLYLTHRISGRHIEDIRLISADEKIPLLNNQVILPVLWIISGFQLRRLSPQCRRSRLRTGNILTIRGPEIYRIFAATGGSVRKCR